MNTDQHGCKRVILQTACATSRRVFMPVFVTPFQGLRHLRRANPGRCPGLSCGGLSGRDGQDPASPGRCAETSWDRGSGWGRQDSASLGRCPRSSCHRLPGRIRICPDSARFIRRQVPSYGGLHGGTGACSSDIGNRAIVAARSKPIAAPKARDKIAQGNALGNERRNLNKP